MIAANIKRILYADASVVTADITPEIAKSLIQAAIAAKDEVKNVHQDTWSLDEAETSPTGYTNQLTGKIYRYDQGNAGDITPSFSIGQYDWKTKADLMGGTIITKGGTGADKDDAIGWKRASEKVVINKVLFCLTDDGVWFIFPNAQIAAREANTDKAIAIAVRGLVQEPKVEGVASEYNYLEEEVSAITPETT